MDVKKVWKDEDWTLQAKTIIEGIREFSKDSKIILMLRHSHRKSSRNIEKLIKLGLTPIGHEIARHFGTLLPKKRPISLYYSIVKRCEETAQKILEGFDSIGGQGELMGSLKPLYSIGGDDNFIVSQAIKYPGQFFINRWAAGLYPPECITPLKAYSQTAANEIWKMIENAPSNGIQIHVTHDVTLVALRLGWFGVIPPDEWISFLGGFALTFKGDKVLLLSNGKVLRLDLPFWWNKK